MIEETITRDNEKINTQYLRNTAYGRIKPEIIILETNSGMNRKYEINDDIAEYFAKVPVGK